MTDSNVSHMQACELLESLLQRLATEIRHTIHNTLGSIELVREEMLSWQQAKHLTHSRDGLHEMLRIVNDIVELSEFESTPEGICLFEPASMLERFCSLIRIRTTRMGLTLQWKAAHETPKAILADRKVIEGSLYRLTDNSIRYAGRGQIDINLRWNRSDSVSGELIIEIRDEGPGIGTEILEDLSHPLCEMRHKGLGLLVVRKQLEAIGGRLGIVSGHHSIPFVAIVCPATVPAPPRSAAIKPEDAFQRHRSGATLRLLVAESSKDRDANFERSVLDEGHRVTRARNGAEAVDLFQTGEYDVVVMDIEMPVLDGYEATRKIREWETQAGRTRVPILLLSTDPSAANQISLGAAAGCSGYLAKPTRKNDLISALRHYAKP